MKNKNQGTIYILHFDEPLHHARHYIDFSQHIDKRMACHEAGNGSKLMKAIKGKGISFKVARTFPGDRTFERKLHRFKKIKNYCPFCKEKPFTPKGMKSCQKKP